MGPSVPFAPTPFGSFYQVLLYQLLVCVCVFLINVKPNKAVEIQKEKNMIKVYKNDRDLFF